MKRITIILAATLLSSVSALAKPVTIKTVEVESVENAASFDPGKVGEVIAAAKEIIALGEKVYTLIEKGKPTLQSDYAPISIVPKDPTTRQAVDPFDMEDCSIPSEKKFLTTINNGVSEVVRFEYLIIYTYGCTYNGKGKYIQSAMLKPMSVKVAYGWDVAASMKLNAIMNHGKKDDPIVGAMLTLNYKMSSWRMVYERNDTVHIAGNGIVKNYSNK